MSTSGTYAFNPALGEIVLYAYNLVGVRNTAVLQEHMQTARMATNMMLSRWANQGVNLWAVDLVTVPLVQGQSTYPVVDPDTGSTTNTVVILDAYIQTDNGSGQPIDRLILPISRTEYASYPNKEQQGFTTTYWFDRLISPTITLWPVPDGTTTSLKYYRVRQIQDANLQSGQQVEVPYLWLEAFAYGLAQRLATIWSPDKAMALKPLADEAYNIAAAQNVETANTFISPMISGYFR
jgi:hypothetical protein